MAASQNSQSREQCIALRTQGYSLRYIAEALGVSQATVRYHTRAVLSPEDPISRREASAPTQPLPPSESLAYLIGVISGDGSLSQQPRTYKLAIACTTAYPGLIETYTRLITDLTGYRARVLTRPEGNWVEVRTYGKHLPLLLGLPCGAKKLSGFTVPEWVFDQAAYVRGFLRGLIETDGGVYRTYHHGGNFSYCVFTARHEILMEAFLRGVVYLGYEFRRRGDTARLSRTAEVARFVEEVGITKLREYRYP